MKNTKIVFIRKFQNFLFQEFVEHFSIINLMQNNQTGLRALVLGASGAVGRDLVQELINSPQWIEITIFVRRTLPEWEQNDQKINTKLKIIKLDNLDELENIELWSFQNINSIFCVIGSHPILGEALYIKVDHDYPLFMAKIAKKNNIPHYSLLTGQGSNKNSYFFYDEGERVNRGSNYKPLTPNNINLQTRFNNRESE
ncbi:hypothetical protein pb186bvf_004039 [Paramecium bursaria]